MPSGSLIVITGPAAVGKSTLARALQTALSRDGALWLVIELDVFARGLSRDWIAVGERAGRHAERGFTYSRAADGSLRLSLGPDGRRVFAAFHRSVAAVVGSGVNVVCETVLFDDEDWRDWAAALGEVSPLWVKLGAPIAVLEAREQADRTRAFQGLAHGMATRPPVGAFDIEADTSVETVEVIAGRIVSLMGDTAP